MEDTIVQISKIWKLTKEHTHSFDYFYTECRIINIIFKK